MNRKTLHVRILSAACFSVMAMTACNQDDTNNVLEEEQRMTHAAPTIREEAPAPAVSEQSIVMESPIPNAPIAGSDVIATTVEVPVAAPVVARNAYLEPATDPHLYFRSPFDPHDDVPPWRANYIGSYGELPTRFQDKGPFLHSFDMSPDADLLNDDDYLGPNGGHHDDDD